MKADNILATIGNTPHIRISRLFGAGAAAWIKSERSNPGGRSRGSFRLDGTRGASSAGRQVSGVAMRGRSSAAGRTFTSWRVLSFDLDASAAVRDARPSLGERKSGRR